MDKPGFYVDIGAHHPYRYSNTFFFYRYGWRGINVEPNPDVALHFQEVRLRDITLSCGCGPVAGSLTYYMFDESALNTFKAEQARWVEGLGKNRVERTINVSIRTLASILDEYLPAGQAIDFMTVDVEGFDLEVLTSNDWQRFRPEFLLVEILNTELNAMTDHEIAVYLRNKGYDLVGKAVHTAFFRRRDGFPITPAAQQPV